MAIFGALQDTINEMCCASSPRPPWRKLFILPRCILFNPIKGNRLYWRDQVKLVKSRISRWQSGGIADLWAEAKITGEKFDNLRKVPKSLLTIIKNSSSSIIWLKT